MITGEQVRDAMTAAGILEVEHHHCAMCGYMTKYVRVGDSLYFDPGCYCTGREGLELRDWADAADWINIQRCEEVRGRLMSAFGLAVMLESGV